MPCSCGGAPPFPPAERPSTTGPGRARRPPGGARRTPGPAAAARPRPGRRPPGSGSRRPPPVRPPRPRSRRGRPRSGRTGPGGSPRAAGLLLARAPPVAGAQEEGAGRVKVTYPRRSSSVCWCSRMSVLKAARDLASQASIDGSVAASAAQGVREDLRLGGPRLARACAGELAGDEAGDGDDVPPRPLDLWAVRTLTVFSPPGRALSRPFSNWTAVRRKPRKARRLASPSREAKPAATSRKWPRVSRRRAARACGEAESSTSRPVVVRTRCSTSMRGSASEVRRERSSAARRAKRTLASAEKARPSSGVPPESRKVSSASAREITSAGSTPSTAAASRCSGSASSLPRWTRRRARRPRRARSRGRSASGGR